MNCIGLDVASHSPVRVEFAQTIASVTPVTESSDLYVAPGWIDIQVNGFAGVDYNRPNMPHEEIARSIHVLYSSGVTRFYPTVITGAPDDMLGALRNLSRAKDALPEGVAIDGFHVEGPHISPDDGPRGAHPRRWVRPPDVDEFRRWQDATDNRIRLITLAPEWPEAPRYIEAITAAGIVASIGHTNAEGHHIRDAISAGATLSTHLGNGAHSMIRRHPNYILEQLAEDRLMADFIVDGVHLPSCYVKVAIRAKGIERSVLVTDASSPAGCKPGRYVQGEQEVDLTEDYRVVLVGQDRLAGSALSMDRGVENLIRFVGMSLADAVRLATTNAAKAGNVPGRAHGLVPGDRGDLVLFRFDPQKTSIQVAATYVGGDLVYHA